MLTKAFAIALGLALLLLGVQSYRLHSAQADLTVATSNADTYHTQLTGCQGTNADEHATVVRLAAQLDDATGQNQQIDNARSLAEARAAQAQHDRDAALSALAHQRSLTYATDPDAHAWADRPLPAVVSDGLRDQWAAAGTDHALHGD